MSTVTVVEFDFQERAIRGVPPEDMALECPPGRSRWIDIDRTDPEAARALLAALQVSEPALDEALAGASTARYDAYDDCLHLTIAEIQWRDGRLHITPMDVLVTAQHTITVHWGELALLGAVRRTYRQDFVEFAKSKSFLLYEFWDHVIESYRRVLTHLEAEVANVQSQIMQEANDAFFRRAALLLENLLLARKYLVAARDTLQELASRRSPFVAESAQPHLLNLAGVLERLVMDISTEREILADTLNLHLGIVSHRTSTLVNRLTVISVIFLPLMFLCGVYGMNFALPEFDFPQRWQPVYFWTLALGLAGSLAFWMRRRGWL
jgi:magnesium transporter